MIIRLILVRIFSFMGTENINDKVEATIGSIYFVIFVFVVYVMVCVAYD